MKTIISHIFNEEYFLPYWLEHHKRIFDHGIIIDYHSTDKSISIIKDICPTWDVITSADELFYAQGCDKQVMDLENNIEGYKIALNVTEFLIGDIQKLININNEQYLLPVFPMIDSVINEFTDLEYSNESLVAQRMHGINFQRGPEFFDIRKARSFHRVQIPYATGRHFDKFDTTDAVILWYGYSPFNEKTIQRKLQIQTKIPESDKQRQFGREHFITREQLIQNFRMMQQHSEDLSDILYPLFKQSWLS